MRWSCLVVAFAFASLGEATLLRGRAESLSLTLEESLSGDWAALSQAEAEDQNFLLNQIDETESQLVQLQQFLEAAGNHKGVMAGLQISATPVDKKAKVEAKPAVNSTESKKEVPTAAKKENAKSEDVDPAKVASSLGIPNLPSLSSVKGLKNTAALAPMLGMLKGLYEDSKSRISEQNVREEKSKKWFTEKEADHKAKLATIEGRFKNHTLSEEFRTNETRDENRYFNYWQRCRERQHRQFHTNLKIQHAMMTKVKKMIDMYEKALSSKPADQEAAKKQLGQMTGMPEIVFLQQSVQTFVQESLVEVRKERMELQEERSTDSGVDF